MDKTIIAVIALLLIGAGIVYFNQTRDTYEADTPTEQVTDTTENTMPVEPDGGIGDGAEPLPALIEGEEQIGQSVDGRAIMAYHYGTGENEIVLVGGLHGGYSWNTALLAYQLVDHFADETLPENIRLTIIPNVNPDGLAAVTGKDGVFTASDVSATDAERTAARFNANDVDLNRNFNCEWAETGTWQNREVSGGDEPFSEPESRAVRDYIESVNPDAVVAYYSAAGGVYSSSCRNGVLPQTAAMTDAYAAVTPYSANQSFDFYDITGDMVNWLAAKEIPAISVLLSGYQSPEFTDNLAGVNAIIDLYAAN
jgi:hypothetical protein